MSRYGRRIPGYPQRLTFRKDPYAQVIPLNIPEFSLSFKTYRVKKVCFAQSGTAINKKRIISISRRLTYSDTACMGQAIAWPDNKIFKSIIRMQPQSVRDKLCSVISFFANAGSDTIHRKMVKIKINSYKMAGNMLSRVSKAALAIILEKTYSYFVRTAYFQGAAIQSANRKLIEPFSGVSRVNNLRTF